MLKKVLMGMLAVVVIGAVVVGVADALTGKSVAAQSVAAQGAVQSTAAQTATQTQAVAGNGQGQAQGQGYRGGQDTTTNGQGGQGTTTNPNPGTPQANITQTVTIAGVVQSFDGVGISLITDDGAPLWVQLGQSRYISAQGVTFTANDHVTATGFYENGQFQASVVVNATTGQTLTLRDASGRPLWAGGAGGKGNH